MSYEVEKLMSANVILTSACNSRCGSCDYWKNQSVYLDTEKIFKFFQYISEYGSESIVITGGEPTLHPQFYQIVKEAKEKYGFVVILSTNGSTIDKLFGKIKDYVDSYCISFDGKDKEEYKNIRGIDNYENIIRNIKHIKEYNENIQVWLSCLIQKSNYQHLEQIYTNGLLSGANGIFFNVPEIKNMCFGREHEMSNRNDLLLRKFEICDLRTIIKKLLIEDEKNGFLCQSEEAIYKFVDYFEMMIEQKQPQKRKCYVPYNTITLTEKGKIRPCFYLNDELAMTLENPVNSQFMLKIREQLDKNTKYRMQCDYCCQFNS